MHALAKLALIGALGVGVAALAAIPEAPKVHVVRWVMVEGCPKGSFRLIVFLSDDKLIAMDETSSDEVLHAARIAIGHLPGMVTKFDCGNTV